LEARSERVTFALLPYFTSHTLIEPFLVLVTRSKRWAVVAWIAAWVYAWASEKRPCLGDFRPCHWYHFCSLNEAGKLPISFVSTFKASDEKYWQPWADRNKNGTNGQRALAPLFIGPVYAFATIGRV
jgi:hypothetical protein